ncbi:hypothetical protein HDU97_010233 [Phlyctochytrium planicorne]|nr:hypothetical protein HDU97_010233 [Phlyctochytrium planicorne]
MLLNADFSKLATVNYENLKFVESPQAGVIRGMLDRDGEEVARATTLVRYAPNSSFKAHTHTGGEEFLVLEGVFADEHGDYPAGTYVRNNIGSTHAPKVGPDGCLIFVKLQFMTPEQPSMRSYKATEPESTSPWTKLLYQSQTTPEIVRMHGITPDVDGGKLGLIESEVELGGAEVLVVEGEVLFQGESFGKWSWIRVPPGTTGAEIVAEVEGTILFVKSRHLGKRIEE